MAQFPKTISECDALKAFLKSPEAKDDKLRKAAERFLGQLEGPVRVAIVGAKETGKLGLMRLFVGRELVPPSIGDSSVPAVIALHGEKPSLAAGWWNGRRQDFAVEGLRNVLSERPDYLEYAYPLPVLEQVSFFKMPAPKDFQDQERRMAWILKRADLILWCKVAGQPWDSDDRAIWAQAPESIKAVSILVATGVNRLSKDDAARSIERLTKTTQGAFAKILPISTVEAMVAAPNGVVNDAALWKSSGGQGLVSALIKLAAKIKGNNVSDAQEFLKAQGVEIPEEQPKKKKEKSKPLKNKSKPLKNKSKTLKAKSKTIRPQRPQKPKSIATGAELRGCVNDLIDQLYDLANEDSELDLKAFIATSETAIDKLADMAATQDLIDPSAAWLSSEVATIKACLEAAKDTASEDDARDVASLLLQISRDISWSVAA